MDAEDAAEASPDLGVSSWLMEYETVRRWAGRIKFSKSYAHVLRDFLEWVEEAHPELTRVTPDDLVELQRQPPGGDQYHVLDLVQDYIRGKDLRYGTKNTYYKQLRSFFLHNRASLPRDPSFNIRGDTPPVNGGLSPEEVREALLSSNKLHRAVFLCMLQGALDLDMLTYWNLHGWTDLRTQLEEELDPVRIDLPGRKNMKHRRPYYTFITSDAIKALRDYLPEPLPRRREAIFINQVDRPVSKVGVADYWKRHLKRTANVEHITAEEAGGRPGTIRYGKNIHELRDTFKTLCSKSDMKYEVAEFFMGHTVDPLGYDKSSTDERYYRRQYMEASEHLNILSSAKAYGLVTLEEIEDKRITKLEGTVDALAARNRELSESLSRIQPDLELVQDLRYLVTNPETGPIMRDLIKKLREASEA